MGTSVLKLKDTLIATRSLTFTMKSSVLSVSIKNPLTEEIYPPHVSSYLPPPHLENFKVAKCNLNKLSKNVHPRP